MRKVRNTDTVMLDEKGRFNLPHRLKIRLEADEQRSLVLHYLRGAVAVWLPDAFEEHVEKLVAVGGQLSDEAYDRAHAWLGTCETVDIDAQGRLRISNELRELAGLTKEVKVLSILDRLELWNPERWSVRFAEAQLSAKVPALPVAAPAAAAAGGA